jgi:uncharacterized protein YecE (DUF72 family)
MAARVHVGAKELKGELSAYAKRFDLLEVRGLDAASLRLAPSAATLRRWRRAVGPRFEFSVVAGPTLARLKPSPEADAELEAMLAAATSLEARVLVVSTPADVTPGKLWRDRLAALVDKLPRDASAIVWEPSGLWEIEDAAAFAKKLGVAVAVDPSRDQVPPGPIAYGRLRALGGTRAYSAAALTRVAVNILSPGLRDAYVVFETAGALKEAKLLRGILRSASSGQTGGLGRLVRPRRAPIEVRDDDEQEE